MDIQKFEELLKQSENDKLDFKETFELDKEYQKKEFAKDVSAIANSRGGRGYIVYGVTDKTREVVGIALEDYDEERVQQVLGARVYPPVAIRFDQLYYDRKLVAVVTIFKSDQRPHQILQTGGFHIRRGSTTDLARRHEIANMLQESGVVSAETTIMHRAALDDLDWEMIDRYFSPGILTDREKALILSEAMGFIGRESDREGFRPTLGGLLLFGREPQKYIMSAGIRFVYAGSSELIEGNIPYLLDEAESRVSRLLAGTEYPSAAVHEALYNAVVHRDYWDFARDITVTVSDEKIEIVNPGAIWSRKKVSGLDSSLMPRKRNPWLYQRLLVFDNQQRFLNNYSGLEKIRGSFSEKGRVKFVNLVGRNIFKVVLPGLGGYREDAAPVRDLTS